jgi:hypothetical protein
MMQISETEVFRACRVLFGSDLNLSRSFLQYLQPSGAHSAFRKQAKTTHPDSSHKIEREYQSKVRLFQDLNQAHQLVQNYLRQRDLLSARTRRSTATSPPKPTNTTSRQPHSRKKPGPLPARPIQIGLYLYYREVIPFSALLGALTWQRRQRPNFGQIAQRWGWLNDQDIKKILDFRKPGRFGERATHLGLLTPIQVRAVLLHQGGRQNKLGSYFTEQGHLSTEELNQLLRDLAEHNQKHRHGHSHHYYYHHP